MTMHGHKIFFYVVLAILALVIQDSAQEQQNQVDEYNVPKEVEDCLKKRPDLKISGQINPFYLSGDLDGDGKLDFAIQVDRSGKRGIAVCLSSQKKPLVVGAGSSLVWPASEEWRFDAWSIVPKESTEVSRPPKAKHDGILLDIKEAANGLLYWDGTALRWKQLSD
jgi:hypothetical protein